MPFFFSHVKKRNEGHLWLGAGQRKFGHSSVSGPWFGLILFRIIFLKPSNR
jgi:hypothetical protein